VVKGRRDRFDGWDGKVASGAWHELAMEMAGDHIQVFFDGKKVIDAHDDTFKTPAGSASGPRPIPSSSSTTSRRRAGDEKERVSA
jgi:hypothetical protein